jgi:hypothetical protein
MVRNFKEIILLMQKKDTLRGKREEQNCLKIERATPMLPQLQKLK